MRRRSLAVAATTAVLVAPAGALSLSTQAPTFPSGVELVRIDVVVVDKDGRPVTGLTAADFEITEGGKTHEIASFEPVVVRSAKPATAEPVEPPRISSSVVPVPEENRYFLIFFDDVHVSAPAAARVRAQLLPFLERETREGDWVTIVAPLAGLNWTARTAYERKQLASIVGSLKGLFVRFPFPGQVLDITEFDAMRAVEYGAGGGHASEVYEIAKQRIRRSLGSLSAAVRSVASFRGRKSVIFYSEGFIRAPSLRDYDEIIDLAHRLHVTLYVIDPRGLRSGLPTAESPRSEPNPVVYLDTWVGGSTYVANATGGRVSISNDATALFREAAEEATAYYLIGFEPSAGGPGERRLKVRVRRDGLKARAPDRYFVGDPAPPARAVPPAVQALNQVADATDIPLRVAMLFLDAAPDVQRATTLAVELPGVPGAGQRNLTLMVDARPLGKGESVRDTADVTLPPSDQSAVATRELQLSPGVWQARVVVRDPKTEKLGSVLHTFEVPEVKGFRVSSPLLGDRLEGKSAPRPALRLDRRYRSSDALYCQYHVYGAAPDPATRRPRVTGSYAILRDGRPVQEGPPSPIDPTSDGESQRLIGFGLSDFPPGDYVLVLRVTDQVSGSSREVREPFSIGESTGGPS